MTEKKHRGVYSEKYRTRRVGYRTDVQGAFLDRFKFTQFLTVAAARSVQMLNDTLQALPISYL
jgi:hypothetical protein